MSAIDLASDLAQALIASGDGGEHDAHHFSYWVYFSTLFNFVVLFGFLAYKLKGPVAQFLVNRRENMGKGLREAQQKQLEAQTKLDEFAQKLANLESEAQRIVKNFEAEANAERERLRADADRAIERFSREADFTINQEVRKAEKAIRDAAVTATLTGAEALIKERITDTDRRRLADEYITQIERGNGSRN